MGKQSGGTPLLIRPASVFPLCIILFSLTFKAQSVLQISGCFGDQRAAEGLCSRPQVADFLQIGSCSSLLSIKAEKVSS